jgi:hypothetical protein
MSPTVRSTFALFPPSALSSIRSKDVSPVMSDARPKKVPPPKLVPETRSHECSDRTRMKLTPEPTLTSKYGYSMPASNGRSCGKSPTHVYVSAEMCAIKYAMPFTRQSISSRGTSSTPKIVRAASRNWSAHKEEEEEEEGGAGDEDAR